MLIKREATASAAVNVQPFREYAFQQFSLRIPRRLRRIPLLIVRPVSNSFEEPETAMFPEDACLCGSVSQTAV